MEPAGGADPVCGECGCEAERGDSFCGECGSLLDDGIPCCRHPEREAEGVCVICSHPFCDECAGRVDGLFLCDEHGSYEIREGLVRVFGDVDGGIAWQASGSMEQAGLHPSVHKRKADRLATLADDSASPGPADWREEDRMFNEFQVLVPCSEVLEAELILFDLGLVV